MADRVATASPVVAARVDVEANSWQDAIRAACSPLVDAGALEPRYAERCIAIVQEHGPYIVLAPGIALAHARPEDGVIRLALSAITLAKPVAFGHLQNDPVDVVIAFGSPDKQAHIGMVGALARRLLAGLTDALRAAPSDGAATALLEEVAHDGR